MSASLETAVLVHHGSHHQQQHEDQAESFADQEGWAVFHLSDTKNHIGVKFLLGDNNSQVQIKATKQLDGSIVLVTVFPGSGTSCHPLEHANPQEQQNLEIKIEEREKQQDGLGHTKNSSKEMVINEDWVKKMRGWLMVLATLVLSLTYQAGINPPGGVWQDDKKADNGTIIQAAGAPVNQDKNPNNYAAFKWFNTAAMAQSIIMVILLVKRSPLNQLERYVHALRVLVVTSILALAAAYSTAFSKPADYVITVFDSILTTAFLTTMLLYAVGKWKDVSQSTKEKVRKVKRLQSCFFWILFCAILVIMSTYNVKQLPPQPWYNIVVASIFAVAIIIWVT